MEIHLVAAWPRSASYPSIKRQPFRTRREELLLKPDVLQKVWICASCSTGLDDLEATDSCSTKVKATKNNNEFFGRHAPADDKNSG